MDAVCLIRIFEKLEELAVEKKVKGIAESALSFNLEQGEKANEERKAAKAKKQSTFKDGNFAKTEEV